MIEILQKIIDLFISWFHHLVPFVILGDDQVGLVRRVGKYHHDLHHGWNWKIPIFDVAFTEISALDSTVLREQSLTTLDGVQVTIRGIITYRVVDARKYILDCATAVSVMNDVGCAVIAEAIPELNAEDVLRGTAFQRDLLTRVRRRAKRWGVEIDSVGIVDRTQATTLRIIGGGDRTLNAWQLTGQEYG
ncbi:MAG: SPFH domain-containing protein [Patescibacteria group bacterium]|nr:SPFH domain-containing protein [Patescibacteria group bacterium]